MDASVCSRLGLHADTQSSHLTPSIPCPQVLGWEYRKRVQLHCRQSTAVRAELIFSSQSRFTWILHKSKQMKPQHSHSASGHLVTAADPKLWFWPSGYLIEPLSWHGMVSGSPLSKKALQPFWMRSFPLSTPMLAMRNWFVE